MFSTIIDCNLQGTQQKKPENLTVPGHLTLQYDTHEVYTKIYNYNLSISDYSMIVATRPDPTVRPPSRTCGRKYPV